MNPVACKEYKTLLVFPFVLTKNLTSHERNTGISNFFVLE